MGLGGLEFRLYGAGTGLSRQMKGLRLGPRGRAIRSKATGPSPITAAAMKHIEGPTNLGEFCGARASLVPIVSPSSVILAGKELPSLRIASNDLCRVELVGPAVRCQLTAGLGPLIRWGASAGFRVAPDRFLPPSMTFCMLASIRCLTVAGATGRAAGPNTNPVSRCCRHAA
jgi:hypothetical protein